MTQKNGIETDKDHESTAQDPTADYQEQQPSSTGCCGPWSDKSRSGGSSEQGATGRQDFMSQIAEMCGSNLQQMMANCCCGSGDDGVSAEPARTEE